MNKVKLTTLSDAVHHKHYLMRAIMSSFGVSYETASNCHSEMLLKLSMVDIPPEKMNTNYIIRVMKNILIDEFRHKQLSCVELNEGEYLTTSESTQCLTYKVIRKYVYVLSPKLRNVLIMKFYFKMASLEMSHLLGIPDDTVRSRVQRGQIELKDLLHSHKALSN